MKPPGNIITVCASGVTYGAEAFSSLGEVRICDARGMQAKDVADADLLVVRSTTPINRDLLAGSRVRFVGTATIGTDHLDTDYLDRAGVAWAHAPGCNALSVSEYITSALLMLHACHAVPLAGRTMGVIGVGQVGRRVVSKARALGLQVLMSDPPLERMGADPGALCGHPEALFVPREQLLAESDIVSLHVPLTGEGQDPTAGMADSDFCRQLKPGCVFINSARGGVMRTGAVLEALAEGRIGHAVIDTWENEPAFSGALLSRAAVGTPHIAGYSFDGKVRGTKMIYDAACRHLGVEASWAPEPLLPEPDLPRVALPSGGLFPSLWEAVRRVYDIREDDRALRGVEQGDERERAARFDRLRKTYRARREFPFTTVESHDAGVQEACRALGFSVD